MLSNNFVFLACPVLYEKTKPFIDLVNPSVGAGKTLLLIMLEGSKV